ncbi:hypothetical protein ACS0TY_024515 [Phlomoides rotata]
MENLNNLIEGSDLTKIQLVGKCFIWYCPDRSCKSKLDRLLVNYNWLAKWPDVVLKGGKRSLSDHVPIFIEGYKKDWGPKLFKFFNQWIQHPNYKSIVERAWNSSIVQGWTCFVIKKKLKI